MSSEGEWQTEPRLSSRVRRRRRREGSEPEDPSCCRASRRDLLGQLSDD